MFLSELQARSQVVDRQEQVAQGQHLGLSHGSFGLR